MELTGINLLLIIFTPVAIIFILMIIMSPLINRVYDRHKPFENEIKNEHEKYIQEIRNNMTEDRVNKNYLYKAEMHDLKIKHTRFINDRLKRIIKTRREESGLDDLVKEIREIKPSDGNGSTVWFLGSLLLTPFALFFTSPLFNRYLESSSQSQQYLFYLIWPVVGLGLGYKGYKGYKKGLALMLCLGLNLIYAFFIMYGVLDLNYNQE